MRYFRRLFLAAILLLFPVFVFAQNFPPLIVEEEDGAPTGVTTKIKVTNGALARSGTVATITVGGGAGDVTGVGNCADGACLDGTSDGGTYISLYDGDSNKFTLQGQDVAGDILITLPATSGTLIHTETDPLSLHLDCDNDPLTDNLEIRKTGATSLLQLSRNQAAISADDIVGRLDIYTYDATDPGICARLEAISYGTSGETGWRFMGGTPTTLIEFLRIDNNGNVGIGGANPTIQPDQLLHLEYVTGAIQRFTRQDTTVTDDEVIGRLEFETKDSGSAGIGAVIQAEAEGSGGEVGLTFHTGTGGATAERLRLTNAGIGEFGGTYFSLGNGATASGILRINEDTSDGSNYASFQVPALAANTIYTLPPDDGAAGEQLQTDGDGVLTWEAAGAGAEATTVSDTATVNLTLTGADITADGLYTAGDDLTLTGADFDVDSTVTRDTEWDTEAEVQTAWGSVNILLETEIDASSELAALMDDETGTAGNLVFSNSPTFDDDIQLGKAGATGILKLYSEQGATDYTASIYPNTAMTSAASFYFPVDEPAAQSFISMSTGGVMSFIAPNAGTNIANDLEEEVTEGSLADNTIVSADIKDGEIVVADTSITAGRSLTWSTNDMVADAETYSFTKCLYWENPIATDDFKSIYYTPLAATITSIWAESDQTVTFMLQTDDGSPSDMDSVDLAPAAGVASDTSLDGDNTLAAGDRVDMAVTSVANTPTWCSVCFSGTYDD